MLEQADVVAHLVGRCRNARQYIRHAGIYFAGIRLSGYGETFFEAHLLRDHGIDFIDCSLIPVKQFQERSLGSGRSLGPKELQVSKHIIQILQIQIKFLHPQCCPLSHRGRLGRLKMGECQGGLGLVLFRKIRKLGNDIYQLLLQQLQPFPHDNNIRIVPHIAGGCPQVDDACRFGTLLPVSIHMAHDIMADFPLPGLCHLIIDIFRMVLQLRNLFVRDDRPAVPA